jgi:hypothetical protein
MKNLLLGISAFALMLACTGSLHAQVLWETPKSWTGTAADVVSVGKSISAQTYNYSDTSEIVGDTNFVTPSVTNYYGPPSFNGGDGSGSTATPYLAALNGCDYVNVIPNSDPSGVSQTLTFTISGLTAGTYYSVQVWDVAGYAGPNNANQRETELSGVSPAFLVGSDYVIGTFTAPLSGTESFTMSGLPGGNYGEINAVAVRDVPEPSTYAMMLAGLAVLGFCVRRRSAQS